HDPDDGDRRSQSPVLERHRARPPGARSRARCSEPDAAAQAAADAPRDGHARGVAASGARAAALGIAAEASGSQRFQISLPDLVLALAEFTEIAPSVDACLVEIVEDQSDRVIPLGPDLHDADVT